MFAGINMFWAWPREGEGFNNSKKDPKNTYLRKHEHSYYNYHLEGNGKVQTEKSYRSMKNHVCMQGYVSPVISLP